MYKRQHQNPSGKARDVALAMAKAEGLTRGGVLECTMAQETYEDLFLSLIHI